MFLYRAIPKKPELHMTKTHTIAVDGNEAVASVAHRLNDVIAIYPITPSSAMGELSDAWSSAGQTNIWGNVPTVVEMQSEAGAAGTVHGALQAGALTTTFTSSQGLLLMIPNLYKIAGELLPFCLHVAARTVATHALSIFGDHSDVMACRQTGVAMLSSSSVQEAHDFACIAQAATLKTRVPFMHFFDGFRTSHEVSKIQPLSDDILMAMIDDDLVAAHRAHAMTPDNPVLRGSSQNPDTFFQMQEARNPHYEGAPSIVTEMFERFHALTGRHYELFEYHGAPDAERVIVVMGSGGDTVLETVEGLNKQGEKVGVVKVRLYRPFDWKAFAHSLPDSVRSIAVLDRTKENGSVGEPLYLDALSALNNAGRNIRIIGGRFGLSGKNFTAAQAQAIFEELTKPDPKSSFSIGITDDVNGLSLPVDESIHVPNDNVGRAMFFGLGSDGTVGANKNSIKIIAENTDDYVQGYFVYDSKKAGAITISHLRYSSEPIRSAYLIRHTEFLACHQFFLLEKTDIMSHAAWNGIFLLNSPYDKDTVWDKLPHSVQETIIDKGLEFYVIDANKVALEAGLGRRINTVMQVAFFALSDVLDHDLAIQKIKEAIKKSYSSKGPKIVEMNCAAVDSAMAHLEKVDIPFEASSDFDVPPPVAAAAPDFVQQISAEMLTGRGDLLPVSAFPIDGTWPVGTAKWEKRNLATEIPAWIPELCIQCNKCALVCPHAAIRVKVYGPEHLGNAPETYQWMDYKGKEFGDDAKYTVQVAPEDCTGCTLCVRVCPGKDKQNPERLSLVMKSQPPLRVPERDNFDFFLDLPEADRTLLRPNVKMSQLAEPLFEYSGACSGCGETPYIKLITQLYGDRAVIANATGCSSIYGGNLPTTPYTTNADGRGPAWANSLFEDNAEFGLGLRIGMDRHGTEARTLLKTLHNDISEDTLIEELSDADQSDEAGIIAQRERVERLKEILSSVEHPHARRLEKLADYLVRKSLWIVGGDGWAYDIGYGGLDHVMASGADVNILVMDTEVYSNTGGQQSKATPMAAAAKFAVSGKASPKKDLGLLAMTNGQVYVASIAFGAKDAQTLRAIQEAESFPGPSLIIAFAHCGEHGYDLADALDQQTLAVETGYWPLYRFDPRLTEIGKPALQLDSKAPSRPVMDYLDHENRFHQVMRHDPERFSVLVKEMEVQIQNRRRLYETLANLQPPGQEPDKAAAE